MNKIIARALSRTREYTPIHTRTPACILPHTPTHAYPRTSQRTFAHSYTYTRICMNLHVRTHVLDFSSLDTWKGYMTEKYLSLAHVFC